MIASYKFYSKNKAMETENKNQIFKQFDSLSSQLDGEFNYYAAELVKLNKKITNINFDKQLTDSAIISMLFTINIQKQKS